MVRKLILIAAVLAATVGLIPDRAFAAQEILVIAGAREEFKSEFNAKVGSPGNLLVRVSLKEKPTQAVTINHELVGALSPQIRVISAMPIVIEPAQFGRGSSLEISYSGSGEAGQRTRIALSGTGGLTKDILITVGDSQNDFAAVTSAPSNPAGANDPNENTPTESEQPAQATLQNVNFEGCGSGTNVLGEPPPCNLSDYIANKEGFVYKSWVIVRSAINILLIIALLAISFSNITRISIDTYTIKKALPNLLIGIVLANASMYIIRFLADMATVIVYFFVNLGLDPQETERTFSRFLSQSMIAVTVTGLETIGGIASIPLVQVIITFIAGIVFIVLLLWLAFLLYFRLVAVYLLTIISPIAFIAYGLPGMDKYFKQWWQQFTKWLFMIVPMAAIFWLMLVIFKGSGLASIASFLIQIVLFVTAVTMPTKLGGAVMDKASKAFMKYSGTNAAKNLAAEKGKDFGKWAASRTPGLFQLQEWNKLRKEKFEADLESRRIAAKTRASSGMVGLELERQKIEKSALENDFGKVSADQQKKALTKGLAARLNSSELEKITSEKLKEKERDDKRLRFFENEGGDERVARLIQEYAKSNSGASALAEALSTQEKIIIGDFTNKRYNALSHPARMAELMKQEEKEREELNNIFSSKGQNSPEFKAKSTEYQRNKALRTGEMQRLEQSFDSAKVDHIDLKDKSLRDLATEIVNDTANGKILNAEWKKQGISYNKGIEAQSEDARKEGSIVQLMRENSKYFQQDPEIEKLLKKLTTGMTVGLDMKTMREFDLLTFTMKDYLRSNRNPNYNGAIEAALKLLVQQGKQELKYVDGKGKAQVINETNLDFDKISALNQGDKSKIVSALYQTSLFSGSPAAHIQSSKEVV